MNKYVVYKPFQVFKGDLLSPGTSIDCYDGKAFYNGKFICLIHSCHSQECLVGDDDNRGMYRGDLIRDIYNLIQGESDLDMRANRITTLWEDDIAKKYVRYDDPSNPWLWDDSYYCANIEDLEYIKNILINTKQYEERSDDDGAN